ADLRPAPQGHLLRTHPAAAVRDLAALRHGDPAAAHAVAEDLAQHRGAGSGAVSRARRMEYGEPDPARVDAGARERACPDLELASAGAGDHRDGALVAHAPEGR